MEEIKLVLEEDVCKCECHVEGSNVMHMMPCCDYTYQHYIKKDGSVDGWKYVKIMEAYKNKK